MQCSNPVYGVQSCVHTVYSVMCFSLVCTCVTNTRSRSSSRAVSTTRFLPLPISVSAPVSLFSDFYPQALGSPVLETSCKRRLVVRSPCLAFALNMASVISVHVDAWVTSSFFFTAKHCTLLSWWGRKRKNKWVLLAFSVKAKSLNTLILGFWM